MKNSKQFTSLFVSFCMILSLFCGITLKDNRAKAKTVDYDAVETAGLYVCRYEYDFDTDKLLTAKNSKGVDVPIDSEGNFAGYISDSDVFAPGSDFLLFPGMPEDYYWLVYIDSTGEKTVVKPEDLTVTDASTGQVTDTVKIFPKYGDDERLLSFNFKEAGNYVVNYTKADINNYIKLKASWSTGIYSDEKMNLDSYLDGGVYETTKKSKDELYFHMCDNSGTTLFEFDPEEDLVIFDPSDDEWMTYDDYTKYFEVEEVSSDKKHLIYKLTLKDLSWFDYGSVFMNLNYMMYDSKEDYIDNNGYRSNYSFNIIFNSENTLFSTDPSELIYKDGTYTYDKNAGSSNYIYAESYYKTPIYLKLSISDEDGNKTLLTDPKKLKLYEYTYDDETEKYVPLENECKGVTFSSYGDGLIKITTQEPVEGLIVYDDGKSITSNITVSATNKLEIGTYQTPNQSDDLFIKELHYDGKKTQIYTIPAEDSDNLEVSRAYYTLSSGIQVKLDYSETDVFDDDNNKLKGYVFTVPSGITEDTILNFEFVKTIVDEDSVEKIYPSCTVYLINEADVSPSESPSAAPSESPSQTTSPAPSNNPSETASPAPDTSASPVTSSEPATTASASPSSSTAPSTEVKKGDTVTVNGTKYVAINKTTAMLKKAKKNVKTFAVPATVKIKGKKLKVTEIGASSFKGNKKLKKLTIGKNVKTIAKNAYSDCTSLKNIIVKSKVLTKIGAKAFYKVPKKCKAKLPKKYKTKYKKLFKKAKYKGKYK